MSAEANSALCAQGHGCGDLWGWARTGVEGSDFLSRIVIVEVSRWSLVIGRLVSPVLLWMENCTCWSFVAGETR